MTFCPHGCIYVSGGVAAQTITTGGTFEKLTAFTNDGPSNGVTAAAASDKLTLPKTGVYMVTFQASFGGENNAEVRFRARWNGVDQNSLLCVRKLGATGTDIGSCSFQGLLDVTVADADLEIWVTSDTNGDDVTVEDSQFSAVWCGTT